MEKRKEKCKHIKKDGQRCRSWAVKGSELCFFHSPETREVHLAATTKGGSVRQFNGGLQPIEIKNAHDICDLLALTINEVRAGILPPQVANTIGFLSVNWLKAFSNLQTEIALCEPAPEQEEDEAEVEYEMRVAKREGMK